MWYFVVQEVEDLNWELFQYVKRKHNAGAHHLITSRDLYATNQLSVWYQYFLHKIVWIMHFCGIKSIISHKWSMTFIFFHFCCVEIFMVEFWVKTLPLYSAHASLLCQPFLRTCGLLSIMYMHIILDTCIYTVKSGSQKSPTKNAEQRIQSLGKY